MQRMRRRAVTAVLVAVLTAAACGQVGGYKENPERTYNDDGMLGVTETNPNLPTSPTYHNNREDQQLIRETLDDFPDVWDPKVVFNGPTAVIYFRVPGRYNRTEVEQLKSRVKDALTYMVPRYEFELRCQNQP